MKLSVLRAVRLPRTRSLLVTMLTVVLYAAMVMGAAGDTTADRVLGQNDFVHNGTNNLNASGLGAPQNLTVDGAGHLYIADTANSRVLGYLSAASFANGAAADLVLGQPNFRSGACDDGTAFGDVNGIGPDSLCDPVSVAMDSNNNLYVADQSNSRGCSNTILHSPHAGRIPA